MSWKEERMLAWLRAERVKREAAEHAAAEESPPEAPKDVIREAMWPGVGDRERQMPSEECAQELISNWQHGR